MRPPFERNGWTGPMVLALLLFFSLVGIPVAAQQGTTGGSVEQNEAPAGTQDGKTTDASSQDLGDWARSYLEGLNTESSGARGTWEFDREVLRALYFLSTGDKDWLEPARDSLAQFQERHGRAARESTVLRAFRGAIEVVRAKHARWPPNKLKHVDRGSEILDEIIRLRPDDLETRYLRYASYAFLPSFLSRDREVAEDTAFLVERLSQAESRLPAPVREALAWSVLNTADLSEEDRSRLTTALAGSNMEAR